MILRIAWAILFVCVSILALLVVFYLAFMVAQDGDLIVKGIFLTFGLLFLGGMIALAMLAFDGARG